MTATSSFGNRKLGEVCGIRNGDRGVNYPSGSDFAVSGIPFVNAGHLKNGPIDHSKMNFITEESFNRLRAGKFTSGDILFCLRGTLGKFGRADKRYVHAAVASSLAILTPKHGVLDPDYLLTYLGSYQCQFEINKWAGGAAQPNLSAANLKKFEIPLPSIQEQKRIASANLAVDQEIDVIEETLAKKRDIKQGVMQQLLTGRTRLPGFDSAWSSTKLSDIASIQMGQSPAGSSYNTENIGLPLIQGKADIRNRRSIRRGWTSSPTKIASKGELLLTVRAPVGHVAIAVESLCAGRGVCVIDAGESNGFLFQSLVFNEDKWRALEQGSTFTAANGDDVRSFEVQWPSDPEERRSIAQFLESLDNELSLLEQKLAKVKDIKQGMMQQLLTGRVRLPLDQEVKA